jgi:hypothetical protein
VACIRLLTKIQKCREGLENLNKSRIFRPT